MTDAEIEESGGVRALRAWVMAATKRALRLYPPGTPNADPDVYDSSIAELQELLRLLEHDAELRATVTVQLGSVLTMRHLARGGVPQDRERARLLLREARDPRTETGAATDADDRRWAALVLLSLVMPIPLAGVGSARTASSTCSTGARTRSPRRWRPSRPRCRRSWPRLWSCRWRRNCTADCSG
ncbi:hypothetical protein SAZ11_11285 [Streptomyces sp. FXJ1.4098]|nr:hypothetical protein [Streptomyces sp. FXJ1.4098]